VRLDAQAGEFFGSGTENVYRVAALGLNVAILADGWGKTITRSGNCGVRPRLKCRRGGLVRPKHVSHAMLGGYYHDPSGRMVWQHSFPGRYLGLRDGAPSGLEMARGAGLSPGQVCSAGHFTIWGRKAAVEVVQRIG